MSEIELYENINNSIEIENKKRIEQIQMMTLSVMAARGNKKAIQTVKELTEKERRKEIRKNLSNNVPLPLFENARDTKWQIKK